MGRGDELAEAPRAGAAGKALPCAALTGGAEKGALSDTSAIDASPPPPPPLPSAPVPPSESHTSCFSNAVICPAPCPAPLALAPPPTPTTLARDLGFVWTDGSAGDPSTDKACSSNIPNAPAPTCTKKSGIGREFVGIPAERHCTCAPKSGNGREFVEIPVLVGHLTCSPPRPRTPLRIDDQVRLPVPTRKGV